MMNLYQNIIAAIQQCKLYAVSIFGIYCISCSLGALMVHTGNTFALAQRDNIVGTALQNDNASINYQQGNKFIAALYDAGGNIVFAAIPQTLAGFGIILPYCSAAYQGWIGGIVTVDGMHRSRFGSIKSACYLLIVLFMQFLPFSLVIGAGIQCGVKSYKDNRTVSWKIWNYRIARQHLMNVGYVFLFSIPLFFLASCFEFLSPWNL